MSESLVTGDRLSLRDRIHTFVRECCHPDQHLVARFGPLVVDEYWGNGLRVYVAQVRGLRPRQEDRYVVDLAAGLVSVMDGHNGPETAELLRAELPGAWRAATSASDAELDRTVAESPRIVAVSSKPQLLPPRPVEDDDAIEEDSEASEVGYPLSPSVSVELAEPLPLSQPTARRMAHALAALDRQTSANESGSCLCMVHVDEQGVHVANVGDCMCLLLSNGRATQMAYEHCPSDPQERNYIESHHGIVHAERLMGRLAISRAFGDASLRPHGLHATPSVSFRKHSPQHRPSPLVLASDGLWNFVKDDAVATIARYTHEL
jgi:protein phosphatase 2C